MLPVFSSETSSPCRGLFVRRILLSKSWIGLPILSHGVVSPRRLKTRTRPGPSNRTHCHSRASEASTCRLRMAEVAELVARRRFPSPRQNCAHDDSAGRSGIAVVVPELTRCMVARGNGSKPNGRSCPRPRAGVATQIRRPPVIPASPRGYIASIRRTSEPQRRGHNLEHDCATWASPDERRGN